MLLGYTELNGRGFSVEGSDPRPDESVAAVPTTATPAALFGDLAGALKMQSGRSTWPDDPKVRPVANRRQGRDEAPRPDPDAIEGPAWQTLSQRHLQRVRDIWDVMPLGETAMGLVVGLGVLYVVRRRVPLAMIADFIGTKIAQHLGPQFAQWVAIPASIAAMSAAVIHLGEGFQLASDANGDKDKIANAKDLIRTATIELGAAMGAKSFGGLRTGSQMEAGELAAGQLGTGNLPATQLPALLGPATDESAGSLVPATSSWLRLLRDETGHIPASWGRSANAQGQPPAVPDLLQVTPNFAQLENPKKFQAGAADVNSGRIGMLLNGALSHWHVTPLQIDVDLSITEPYLFSEKEWRLTIGNVIARASFDPLHLHTEVNMMATVFARVMQCWEVIRYMRHTLRTPVGNIETLFAAHVVEDAITDMRERTPEQQARVKTLSESMTSQQALDERASVESKYVALRAATQRYQQLENATTPAELAQKQQAFGEWQRALWAAQGARDQLAKRPHMSAALDAGRKAEQKYRDRTIAARERRADEDDLFDYGNYGAGDDIRGQ